VFLRLLFLFAAKESGWRGGDAGWRSGVVRVVISARFQHQFGALISSFGHYELPDFKSGDAKDHENTVLHSGGPEVLAADSKTVKTKEDGPKAFAPEIQLKNGDDIGQIKWND
jgi:hypothetical protein